MTEDTQMLLLEKLVSTPGVPGREERIRAVIERCLTERNLVDDIRVDALGSLIGIRRSRPKDKGTADPLRILVAAHIDQVGFLVSHISERGFLRLHPVGAFDARTLVSQRVKVCTEAGEDFTGFLMLQGHPVHTAPEDDRNKVPKLPDLFVDLGLPAEKVLAKVQLGDMVVFDTPFADLQNSVAGPGMDNRVGCWALLQALEALDTHNCEIHVVFTAQEELGSRGAQPASFGIQADIGISCDTVACCDVPGVSEEQYVACMGDGVSLLVADSSALADMSLVRKLETTATECNIRSQRSLMLGGGQDGAMIQRSRFGVRTVCLSCPVRYMHTSNELVSKSDLESYHCLLTELLETL